jgi:LAS superfamily LD-carboxypeptidase LdcB
MKKGLKIFSVALVMLLVAAAGVILISDKLLGTNSLQAIKESIESRFTPAEPLVLGVDNTPLEVSYITTDITTYESSTAITLKSNKKISSSNPEKYNLVLVKEQDEYVYALEVKNLGVGPSNHSIEVKDEAGNAQVVTLSVAREDFTLPFGLKAIENWPDSVYTVDGDNLLAQVNKQHKLINDYIPEDLKNLNTDYLLYTNTGSILLKKEAADYLKLMLEELKRSTGKNVVIASGYRSFNEQYRLYSGWVRQLGQEEADKVSARPGFSEHQLGTVVDFIEAETGLTLTNDFDNSVAGKWLIENAQNYGFVQSYPEGKESITGYSREAWHYRFIGIDSAKEMKMSGLALKEWIETKTL